jgi:hypothetical protein
MHKDEIRKIHSLSSLTDAAPGVFIIYGRHADIGFCSSGNYWILQIVQMLPTSMHECMHIMCPKNAQNEPILRLTPLEHVSLCHLILGCKYSNNIASADMLLEEQDASSMLMHL